MKIHEVSRFKADFLSSGYHVLVFADMEVRKGSSTLEKYASQFEVSDETAKKFSAEVNNRVESGSLFPRAPISAIPMRAINDKKFLKQEIISFIKANDKRIHARRIIVDPGCVNDSVIKVCSGAFGSQLTEYLEEAVIIKPDIGEINV